MRRESEHILQSELLQYKFAISASSHRFTRLVAKNSFRRWK